MPPPDNTPPVMTPKIPMLHEWHLKLVEIIVSKQDREAREDSAFQTTASLLRDIESVVRTIVESGGTLRLAGEDEVIVKRKELEEVREHAVSLGLSAQERHSLSEALHSLHIIAFVNDRLLLAVSPTTQEGKDGTV